MGAHAAWPLGTLEDTKWIRARLQGEGGGLGTADAHAPRAGPTCECGWRSCHRSTPRWAARRAARTPLSQGLGRGERQMRRAPEEGAKEGGEITIMRGRGGGGGIDCEMSCWTRLSGQDIFQIRGAASGHRGAEAVGKAAEAARHGRGRRRQQRQRSSVGAVKEQAPRPRGGSDGVGKGKSHHLPTGQARDIPGRPPDCLRSAVGPVCGGEEKERGGRRGAVRARRRWRWTQRGKAAPQEGTTNGA